MFNFELSSHLRLISRMRREPGKCVFREFLPGCEAREHLFPAWLTGLGRSGTRVDSFGERLRLGGTDVPGNPNRLRIAGTSVPGNPERSRTAGTFVPGNPDRLETAGTFVPAK